MSSTDVDFNKLCRICLTEQDISGKINKLFAGELKINNEKGEIPLHFKIMSCAPVQVLENDHLPQIICNKCTKQLEENFQFRELIERSDAKLRQFIKNKDTSKLITMESTKPAEQLVAEKDMEEIELKEIPEKDVEEIQLEEISENDNGLDQAHIENLNEKRDPQPKPISHICEICLKKFKTSTSLKTHQRIHEKNNLQCPICDKEFAYRRLLIQHNLSHTEERYFLCSECGKSFKTKGQLDVHARRHYNNRPFECRFCDKKFFQVSHRNQHLRLHTDERPFSCEICEKTFRSQTSWKSHARMHEGVKPYECSICSKKFSLKLSLQNHVRSHSGNLFVCRHCDKKFVLESSLKSHLRIHEEDNENVCQVCEKKFSNAIHLEEHARTHAENRDFVCPTCGKTFRQSAGLSIHLKTHNTDRPYECDKCDKSFTSKQTFDVHYRRHTGAKPFECEFCGKCFRQGSTLRTHKSVHTRPFKCLCEKAFSQKSLFEKHLAKCNGFPTQALEPEAKSELVTVPVHVPVTEDNQNEQIVQYEPIKMITQQIPAPTFIIQMAEPVSVPVETYVPIHYQIL